MRINIKPRAEVAVRPELKISRPPDDYIDILTKSEAELRKYIVEIESSPAFNKMLSNGIVKKVGFRGRIPSHIYQEFQDREFMDFLKKYEVSEKFGWETDFFDKKAIRNIAQLSQKYSIPKGDLAKALEYCKNLQLSWQGMEKEDFTSFISLDDTERFHQIEDTKSVIESDRTVSELADIIERYEISEQDFIEYFLSGSFEPFDIARDLDLDLNCVEEIIDLVDRVNIINSMQVNVVDRQQSIVKKDTKPIAVIKRLNNPPRAEIQIDADEEYSCRYNIEKNSHISDDEQALIDKLKMINQRRSLVFKIIRFIYKYQYMYFVSMNPCHLKPLSQAQIAREMGEHESTISRILRHKYIETDEGIVSFKFFCQNKGEIIARIINIREKKAIDSGERNKPFSDAEIADILEKEYGIKVSRRTVTYYRNKANNSPKYYMRKKMIKKENKGK
jgi:hypothetical protein